MKLFASVYFDEDVSVLISTLIQARGFQARAARDENMLGKDDPQQLEHAISLHCCIVTHNRVHFEELHREYIERRRSHFSIIVATHRSPYEIANRLATLLDTFSADEIENQLLYI